MLIIQILMAILIGYIIGFMKEYSKRKRQERECLNKKQMIENRDKLIENQERKIRELQHDSLMYKTIKEVYKSERKIIDRHDKVKELIAKDN